MRPRDIDYKRFIHLVDTYRSCEWDAHRQWSAAPFKVADLQTTSILLRSTSDLLHLAKGLSLPKETCDRLREMEERLIRGLKSLWRPSLGRFVSVDLISRTDVDVITQASFLPLLGLQLETVQRDSLLQLLDRVCSGTAISVPSTPPFSSSFESKRYWRGPVWAIINWLISDGLRLNGLEKRAVEIEKQTVSAMEKSGFCEYFDPLTAEGLGGDQFSWTAAAYLVLSKRV